MITFATVQKRNEPVAGFKSGRWYKVVAADLTINGYVWCSESQFTVFRQEYSGPTVHSMGEQTIFFANLPKGAQVFNINVDLSIKETN